jgi:Beta/Gamma crystallin
LKRPLQYAAFATLTLAVSTAMAGVTFYEAEGFRGQPLTANGTISDFRDYDFNDRAMSLVVEGAPVEVCADINFGGNCQVFKPGRYPALGVWAHDISSVRPASYGREERGYDQRDRDRRVERDREERQSEYRR